MFHPNIYTDGKICLDILGKEWSSAYDCFGILTSIQSLLTDPNPFSPANTAAAQLFLDAQKLKPDQKEKKQGRTTQASGQSAATAQNSDGKEVVMGDPDLDAEYYRRVRECVENSWLYVKPM